MNKSFLAQLILKDLEKVREPETLAGEAIDELDYFERERRKLFQEFSFTTIEQDLLIQNRGLLV